MVTVFKKQFSVQ